MLQISLSMMRTFGEEKYDYQKYSGSHMIVNGIKIVLKDFPRKKGFFFKNFSIFPHPVGLSIMPKRIL